MRAHSVAFVLSVAIEVKPMQNALHGVNYLKRIFSLSGEKCLGGLMRLGLHLGLGLLLGLGLGLGALAASSEFPDSAPSPELSKSELIAFAVHADGVREPLGGVSGDVQRGASIVQSRDGQCTLCHAVPGFAGHVGNLAPSLAGVGGQLSAAQLRLRIIDSSLLNPQTIMPSFYKVSGLVNVDPKWRGQSILNAQQVEDVVAYLLTLKE